MYSRFLSIDSLLIIVCMVWYGSLARGDIKIAFSINCHTLCLNFLMLRQLEDATDPGE